MWASRHIGAFTYPLDTPSIILVLVLLWSVEKRSNVSLRIYMFCLTNVSCNVKLEGKVFFFNKCRLQFSEPPYILEKNLFSSRHERGTSFYCYLYGPYHCKTFLDAISACCWWAWNHRGALPNTGKHVKEKGLCYQSTGDVQMEVSSRCESCILWLSKVGWQASKWSNRRPSNGEFLF